MNPLDNISPITIEIGPPDQPELWEYILTNRAQLLVEEGGRTIIEYADAVSQTIRVVWFAEVTLEKPGYVEGVSIEGNHILARLSEEDDVVVSGWFNERIPLPLAVISAKIEGYDMDDELQALVADDGLVRTMLLVTDVGMYCRYSTAWIRLESDEPIDGLNAVDVEDEALQVYDDADTSGQIVAITSMPVKDLNDLPDPPRREIVNLPVEEDAVPGEEPATPLVTGPGTAAAVSTLPILYDADDITPEIIAQAEVNDELRWYVEKRANALGFDVPWATTPELQELTDEAIESEVGEPDAGLFDDGLTSAYKAPHATAKPNRPPPKAPAQHNTNQGKGGNPYHSPTGQFSTKSGDTGGKGGGKAAPPEKSAREQLQEQRDATDAEREKLRADREAMSEKRKAENEGRRRATTDQEEKDRAADAADKAAAAGRKASRDAKRVMEASENADLATRVKANSDFQKAKGDELATARLQLKEARSLDDTERETKLLNDIERGSAELSKAHADRKAMDDERSTKSASRTEQRARETANETQAQAEARAARETRETGERTQRETERRQTADTRTAEDSVFKARADDLRARVDEIRKAIKAEAESRRKK